MVKHEVAAGAVVYNPQLKMFLLLKHRQGHWAFPQGKQERNEQLEETLLRELDEETGMSTKAVVGPVCEVTYSFSYRRRKTEKVVHFWAVTSTDDVHISSEHHGFVWVKYKDAKKMLSFDNHLQALKKGYSALKKKKLL